jgi:outer membrane protein assembly factor BamB
VAAVDPRSGSVLWRRELSTNLGLTTDFVRLYLTDAESQVWALHPENGQTYWKQDELHGRRLTAPTLYDRYLVVGDTEGYVYWISTEDGRLAGLERVDRAAITARPVVFENTLYVLAEDGTVSALEAGED